MLRTLPPVRVFFAAFTLPLMAGIVNAIGFLSVARQGVTHVTGAVTLASIEAVQGHGLQALATACTVACFLFGAAVSGGLIHGPELRFSGRYAIALTVEAGLLFAATIGFRHEALAGQCLTAAAVGLQNALATRYSGASLRTTHLTGIVTDVGVTLGQAISRQHVDSFRLRLYLVILAGFVSGGLLGAVLFGRYETETLLVPATLAMALAMGIALWRRQTGETA